MPTNENQNGELKNQQLNRDFDEQSKSVDESRRRFAQSSLIVSGVILTLASRPVLGATCQSPSGFVSGNVSNHGTPTTCSGRTPGYWGTHPEVWPTPYLPGKCSSTKQGECTKSKNWSGGTTFCSVFACTGYGAIYSKYTMMQVIWLGGNADPQQLGAHIVAALLNAKMGWTPVLTEAQVIAMFNEWNLNGYFEPTAGVKWYAADIVAYLQTTMPL